MRNALASTVAALLVGLSAAPAPAQILGRLQKAVEKRAEEKMNAKLDELAQRMVDNSFAAVFGDSGAPAPGGGTARSGPGAGSLPFSIGTNAKTEDQYRFDVVTAMEIETWRRDGKSAGKALLKLHFNTAEPWSGTAIESVDGKRQDGTAFIVLDAKNHAMVMLMTSEKDKKKFSIAYDWKDAQRYAESVAQRSADQVNWDTVTAWRNYTKIGTKTIAGYTADGYKTEGPEGSAEFWVSRDRRLGGGAMFGANSNMRQFKGRLPSDMPYGMLLEMTSVNAGTGEKATMRVTEINTSANVTYAMSDYPRMEMGRK